MKLRMHRTLGLNPQKDVLDTFEITPGESPVMGADGVMVASGIGLSAAASRTGFLTTFPLLPATTQAAANDKFLITLGTNTEAATVSTKGGVNLATSGSANDNALLIGVANTASKMVISATNLIQFSARISIPTITSLIASFGLNENITDTDPTGTAGDGAAFLFATDAQGGTTDLTVTSGLTTAQHANWILAHKVNGADTFTATSVPVIAGRDYLLQINIGTDLIPLYYIDGTYVGAGPALTAGDSVYVQLGIETPASAARSFDARAVSLTRALA